MCVRGRMCARECVYMYNIYRMRVNGRSSVSNIKRNETIRMIILICTFLAHAIPFSLAYLFVFPRERKEQLDAAAGASK